MVVEVSKIVVSRLDLQNEKFEDISRLYSFQDVPSSRHFGGKSTLWACIQPANSWRHLEGCQRFEILLHSVSSYFHSIQNGVYNKTFYNGWYACFVNRSNNQRIEIAYNNRNSLDAANLKTGAKTVIIIDGFLSDSTSPMSNLISESKFKK